MIKLPASNIIFHGEKPKVFPLRSIMRQGLSLLTTPFLYVLEVLDNGIRKEKKRNEKKREKKKGKGL